MVAKIEEYEWYEVDPRVAIPSHLTGSYGEEGIVSFFVL